MTMSTTRGQCFCGAVEIEVTGEPVDMGYCHCTSCRTYSGAPVSAYMLWPSESVRVVRGAAFLGQFSKTPMSDRKYCTICAGHIMTVHPGLGMTDVRPPVLPGIAFKPVVHLHYAETVLPIRDGLPKLRDFPAEVGGSGERVPE